MTQNLTTFRGDNYDLNLTFKDAEGDAVPITDWVVYFTVKREESDADLDALIAKRITSHTDATNGQTKVSLTSDDTDLDPGSYAYDIQVKKADGKILTILKDVFVVKQDITQSIS